MKLQPVSLTEKQITVHWELMFVQLFILLALIGVALLYRALQLSAQSLIYPCCVLFVALVCWNAWAWKKQIGRFVDPYLLFLAAAVLFNGGQALLEIFQLNRSGILENRFSPETTLNSLFLITLGLSALHLGALLSPAFVPRSVCSGRKPPVSAQQWRAVRLTGWAAISISLVPCFAVLGDALRSVMSYGYFVGLFQQDASTGLGAAPNVLAMFLIPGTLLLLASSRGQRLPVLVSGIIVWSYSAINLFIGARAPGIAALVAYYWIRHIYVRPVKKTAMLAGITAILVVMPVIAIVRNLGGEHRATAKPFVQALKTIDNPAVAIVSEMGNSMRTVAHTLDLVPAVRAYDLGRSYGYAFLTVFPNLFWDVHPAVARGLLGSWLIWTVDPGTAAINGGLGFSFLAEAYLNFGWVGCPFALLVIGIVLGALSAFSRNRQDPAIMAVVACILYFVLIFARGESASIIRGITWHSLAPLFLIRLWSNTHFSPKYIPLRAGRRRESLSC